MTDIPKMRVSVVTRKAMDWILSMIIGFSNTFLHRLTLSQVCTGEAASFVAQCWTNLNADAPGAVRLREALARHLSVFVPSDDQRLLCPNCQDDLTAVLDRIEGIK